MSNVSRLRKNKLVFQEGSSASGIVVLFHPEQNIMLKIKIIIRELTLPGGLVVNCGADMYSVPNARVLLPQQRQDYWV